jgi:hypothetical protein
MEGRNTEEEHLSKWLYVEDRDTEAEHMSKRSEVEGRKMEVDDAYMEGNRMKEGM